jgi:hypothetical protein
MLLVLANRYDRTADILAARWAGAAVLRPADLSVGGWSYSPGDAMASWLVAGGQAVQARNLTGVLTRMACVFEGDLGHIRGPERSYVASEMTAVLLAWLTELAEHVPVVNRPTATCLLGPMWPTEKWLHLAAKLNIPVVPARRTVGPPGPAVASPVPESMCCTVIDGVVLGAPTPQCEGFAARLAKHTGCRLLSVHVVEQRSGHAVAGVDLWPDLTSVEMSQAVLDALLSTRGGARR